MISVIIPAYNHAKTLSACITSVLGQKDVNVEIIVVDDGSTDNTNEVLKPFSDRVKIISQKNRGANPARNRGFEASKGEYVLFLDADAIMPPTFLKSLLRGLGEHPEAAYAYADFYFGFKRFHTGPFRAERLRTLSFIHTSALIRREAFPGFDPAIKRFQDWDLWLTMLAQGYIGTYVAQTALRMQREASGAPISTWMPRIFYKTPFKYLPAIRKRVKKYESARAVIVAKHNL